MCFAQGHNAVAPVRLEHAAPRSRVKHSTTEPLRSLIKKKNCVKRPQIGFQDQLSLNAGQKYCRMLQGEHSAILLTFIKLPFVIKSYFFLFLSGPFTQV